MTWRISFVLLIVYVIFIPLVIYIFSQNQLITIKNEHSQYLLSFKSFKSKKELERILNSWHTWSNAKIVLPNNSKRYTIKKIIIKTTSKPQKYFVFYYPNVPDQVLTNIDAYVDTKNNLILSIYLPPKQYLKREVNVILQNAIFYSITGIIYVLTHEGKFPTSNDFYEKIGKQNNRLKINPFTLLIR